jgi:hypothetical protein
MIIRKVYRDNLKEDKLLKTEYELLQRIFLKLFPNIFKGFFTSPVIAWRRFYVTTIALSGVASGYLSYSFKKPPN